MLSKALGVIIIILIPIMALQQCQVDSLSATLDDTKKDLVQSQDDLEAAVLTNGENVKTINDLESAIKLRDKLAGEQVDRSKKMSAELNAARKNLRERANYDQTLRDYLDANIHAYVAAWLLSGSNGTGSGIEGAGKGVSAGEFIAVDAEAYEPVTQEEGWEWARATDKALDDCNADKAAIIEWENADKKLSDGAIK